MDISDMSFSAQICCLSGYLLAKTKEPVRTCSEYEEVTKPVQEAGNGPKIQMDPWPGLQTRSEEVASFLPETWFW